MRRIGRWSFRILAGIAILAVVLFGISAAALQFWIIPHIDNYRPELEQRLSALVKQRVAVGRIVADWEGLHARARFDNVRFIDAAGHDTLQLSRLNATLAWSSLVLGQLRVYSLDIEAPRLAVRRDIQGVIYVAGVPINRQETESGFGDWLLRQRQFVIRNATVVWEDQRANTAPILFRGVNLHWKNFFGQHTFGLTGVPPTALGAPFDVRGDVHGQSTRDFSRWYGKIYAQLERADLSAWHRWVPLPFDIARGFGSMRVWLDFKGRSVESLTADLSLNDALARFSKTLPYVDLRALKGRVALSVRHGQYQFNAPKLLVATADGDVLPATDLMIRYDPGSSKSPAKGDIRVDSLRLDPLAKLAFGLPLTETLRQRITALEPRGTIQRVAVSWDGPWFAPTHFSAKGRLSNVAVTAAAPWPGFQGLNGDVSATDRDGQASLEMRGGALAIPTVLRDPIPIDKLSADVKWRRDAKAIDVTVSRAAAENPHAAGTADLRLTLYPQGRPDIDLTGRLSRADGRFIARYLPATPALIHVSDWLDGAIVQGTSQDVRFRVKGNLGNFPFAEDKGGIFDVTAKVHDGILNYAQNWPRVEAIDGLLEFRGRRMDIRVDKGSIAGFKISRLTAAIPDLLHHDEHVLIAGEATGATDAALKFVTASPIRDRLAPLSSSTSARGNGNLALKLDIPIRRLGDTGVAGKYQFLNDTISLNPAFPTLERVDGVVQFTDKSLTIPKLTAALHDSPFTIASAPGRPDEAVMRANGRITAATLQRLSGNKLLDAVSGATDWQATIVARHSGIDFAVESNLVGLASQLPEPLSKTAGETVPLRLERQNRGVMGDAFKGAYGRAVQFAFERTVQPSGAPSLRGTVGFNTAATLKDSPGISVIGELAQLDVDRWRKVLAGTSSSAAGAAVGTMNLKIGRLDAFNKRFNNLHIVGKSQVDGWQATLDGREIVGDVSWDVRETGLLKARLKTLIIPPSLSAQAVDVSAPDQETLPALDIVADNFQVKQKKLGKLEMLASQRRQDWVIEKIRISNPESVLTMDGIWEGWLRRPQTRLNVNLSISDVGKYLTRMGFADAIRRGTAKVTGELNWFDSPDEFDLRTLSGKLSLEAQKGQFLKAEPGIGKLLSIVSLQALPRRITLDFRDIFSEGFAFDTVSATMKLDQGVLSSSDFVMAGPAAKIAMAGETDLVKETQNLRVHVVPQLGESFAVAGALVGGPIVGLTTFVVQKALKDPLNQMAGYQYNITGTWSDPKVTRISRRAAAANEPQ